MTRQQKLRMRKEQGFKAVKLAKPIDCGTHVNIQKETDQSVLFEIIKTAFPNLPWIEFNRIEIPHRCKADEVSSFTENRKIEMMIV